MVVVLCLRRAAFGRDGRALRPVAFAAVWRRRQRSVGGRRRRLRRRRRRLGRPYVDDAAASVHQVNGNVRCHRRLVAIVVRRSRRRLGRSSDAAGGR